MMPQSIARELLRAVGLDENTRAKKIDISIRVSEPVIVTVTYFGTNEMGKPLVDVLASAEWKRGE